NDKVKCFGFIPDKESIAEIHLMLERLENKSPSYSNMSVNFFREGDNFQGEILITSGERIFVSKDISTNISTLLAKLEKKMARKLRQWRQIRTILPSLNQGRHCSA